MNRSGSIFAYLSVLVLPACSMSGKLGDSTPGESGKISFSYSTGLLSTEDDFDCLFGCSIDQGVVPGSTHRIDIEGPGAADATSVDSGNPDVAELSLDVQCSCEKRTSSSTTWTPLDGTSCDVGWTKTCQRSATFVAGQPGKARMTVTDSKGRAIDSTTLRVVAPVRAVMTALDPDEHPVEEFRIPDGGNAGNGSPTLRASFFASNDERLRTSKAVTWSTDNPEIASIEQWFSSVPTLTAGSTVLITPLAPGKATFHARVGNVEVTKEVDVTR